MTIGIQTFRLPTHGPIIHSTEDGNHSDRNSRASAGRCKVVHLHPLDFWILLLRFLQNTIHAQCMTQRHHQTLFYRVKYYSWCWCSTSKH